MTFTVYDVSIPVFQQALKSLAGLLVKAEAHAAENDIDIASLLDAKLAPDMFSLTRQIQIATDHAKGAAARLAGVEMPAYADTEKTVAELQARLQKTQDFIAGLKPEQFVGAEALAIKLVYPWATYDFTGQRYLTYWALPNFFFHVTTAYNILRHQGVKIGKADFLGH